VTVAERLKGNQTVDAAGGLSYLSELATNVPTSSHAKLLIIDYLQLIDVTDRSAGENQTQRISFISKNLKNLARELHCPVIALSQLSRPCEQRTPPIPILSDLRDSGAIEQDADSVLMLYRSGYYDPDCPDPDITDVYLRKNRQGPTGHVELRFSGKQMSFQALQPH
jgi:replicative DNA helicase